MLRGRHTAVITLAEERRIDATVGLTMIAELTGTSYAT